MFWTLKFWNPKLLEAKKMAFGYLLLILQMKFVKHVS